LADTSGCLRKQRMGAEHMTRQEFSGWRKRPTPWPAYDQSYSSFPLHLRYMLGHRGLTDSQLPRRRGK